MPRVADAASPPRGLNSVQGAVPGVLLPGHQQVVGLFHPLYSVAEPRNIRVKCNKMYMRFLRSWKFGIHFHFAATFEQGTVERVFDTRRCTSPAEKANKSGCVFEAVQITFQVPLCHVRTLQCCLCHGLQICKTGV